ncbi:type II toxin-antitoxin system VapC family toxin [Deferrisoma sp.]
MNAYLVDSNVLLDVLTEDSQWFGWSSDRLRECADRSVLVLNPIICAKVNIGVERIEELDACLPRDAFRRDPLPWPAAFLAGKAFLSCRRRGGVRTAPLPDFYIGAHAAAAGLALPTRDARRYRTYFPRLRLIAPWT